MTQPPLLRMTTSGLYCEVGGFHIDPCGPVARALVTHAHSDHFVAGCCRYLTAAEGTGVLSERLPQSACIDSLRYGESLSLGGVTVSLHPAGHVLGSAQVRVEHRGEVWVATGDYQRTPNRTCTAFEPVRCHHLVTESTFGHPFFRWPAADDVFTALHDWWRANQSAGRASLLYAYSFGKAQRLLAGLNRETGPVVVTREIAAINAHYQAAGIDLGETQVADEIDLATVWRTALFVVPPSARWRQPFPFHGQFSTACASGWMLLPGQAHRRRVDTGFVLSDHADHADILAAIDASGPETVWVTHGYIDALTAELAACGRDARPLRSPRCSNPPAVTVDRQLEFALSVAGDSQSEGLGHVPS